MKNCRLAGSSLVVLSGLLAAVPAFGEEAQSAPEAPVAGASGAKPTALAEIVVTAERRTVNIQKVPTAVTAIAGSQLAAKAVVRAEDLANVSPSLSVSDTGVTQNINIRGIGISSITPNVVSGVAEYMDGIFEDQILGGNIYYDIASVEVLRGPQGTLVGSNSTGGAIFIRSVDPSLTGVSGYLQGGLGNYANKELQGAINVPLASTLAIRVAANVKKRDSFYKDLGLFNSDAGKLDEKDARVSLLWRPGDFQLLNKAEWVDRTTGGFAFRPTPGTLYADGAEGGIRTLSYNDPEFRRERSFQDALELKYTTESGIVLRSQSGYQYRRFGFASDTDATQLDHQTEFEKVREHQYTQEINIISPADARFTWIVGGYYQRNNIDVIYTTFNEGFPTSAVAYPRKTTTGLFGQVGYKFTPKLSVDFGLRYSHYKVHSQGGGVLIGAGFDGFPPDGLLVASTSGDHADGRLTGKAAINFKPDDNNLIYAFAARGYKSGGFNSPVSEFGPETVWNYELGWKTSFLDRRVRLQLDAFYNNYQGYQYDNIELDTGQLATFNLKDATIKGVEAQFQAKFGDLSFDGGAAYVDSQLSHTSIINTLRLPPGTSAPQCGAGEDPSSGFCFDYTPYIQNNSGGPNLYSPRWTVYGGVEYETKLDNDWSVTPRINVSYMSGQFTYLGYSRLTDYLPARTIVSALLTVSHANTSLEAYVTNLTDAKYVSGQAFYAGTRNNFYGAPREFGARLTQRF